METVVEISDSQLPITYRGNLIAKHDSPRQKWVIIDHIEHGEMLFIDGQHQSSVMDEHYYHETFVHTLMTGLQNPKRILILGGAEGCLAREVLRYKCVEVVHQVDWDESLIEHFKGPKGIHWNDNAYADPRLSVFSEEALGWLEKCTEEYDAIFVDLLDPTVESLKFMEQILIACKKLLHGKGGLAINAGIVKKKVATTACDLAVYMRKEFCGRFQRLSVKTFIPSYMGEWCFLMIVPNAWSCRIHSVDVIKGLQGFNKDILIHNVTWKESYPTVLRKFWMEDLDVVVEDVDVVVDDVVDKKLARLPTLPKSKDITEYYGC